MLRKNGEHLRSKKRWVYARGAAAIGRVVRWKLVAPKAGRTLLYPTISLRELLCLPKSGPAVTGAGDLAVICSGAGSKMPLLANDG